MDWLDRVAFSRDPEGFIGASHFGGFNLLGKTLGTISAVQMDFVQIAFQPPPPQATGPFGATFFAEN